MSYSMKWRLSSFDKTDLNLIPSPREFGLSLIKFQVDSSEFTRRGGPYFIIKNLRVTLG